MTDKQKEKLIDIMKRSATGRDVSSTEHNFAHTMFEKYFDEYVELDKTMADYKMRYVWGETD